MNSINTYFVVNQKLRHPDWENAKNQALSIIIQIKSQGIRILLLSANFKEALGFDEINFTRKLNFVQQIEQIQAFTTDSLLSETNPQKVYLVLDSEVFTLCPSALYVESEKELLLQQLARPTYKTDCFADLQPNTDFHLIHAIPTLWTDWANQLYTASECEWHSILGGLLANGKKLSASSTQPIMLAHIDSSHLYILGFEMGNVLIANRFSYQSENDLLYYMLLIIEELKAKPEEIRVILTGNILSGSLGFEKLSRYIANLEFGKHLNGFEIPSGLDALHHHNYMDLASLPSYLASK